ncbi:MAG: SDR family oxidoreductase [Alphaproteobacteria bacterium]|nr:SDR family oxidoreductase [Alphaproteobacteria bacterium]
MSALQGKIAWVTGAGSGIGKAGALELARGGAVVALSGRREAELRQVADQIAAEGGRAEVEPLDVSDKLAVQRTANRIIARHGKVDILVNSAGLNIPRRFWKEIDAENWDQVVDVNLNGSLYCIASVIENMRRRKDGLVINISSWAGKYDTYMTGPAYNASKHAVVAMSASLNLEECVNGIRCCCICPGEVATPIMQRRPVPPAPEELARMLQEEDMGRTIRFVAEMPPHVCVNEIVISPTWNRINIGGADIARR